MTVFSLYFRTSWSDYFPATYPTNLDSQNYNSRQTPSGSSIHVSNCLFYSITSSDQGGALYCSGSVTYFLVESSSFFSCKTSSGYGGGIYFSNNGQSVLYKVCSYDCTNKEYLFAYICVNSASSSINYVNYSSVTRCVNENSGSFYSLGLGNGKICCPSINISMNRMERVSAIHCFPYSVSNSVTCSLTYSTFANNNDFWWICIYFSNSGTKYEINSCNIIRNTQGNTSSYGTFYTTGNLMIEDSCILENKAPYIFYVASTTITLSNCTVDVTSSYVGFKTQNTITKSFVLALNHMSTQNCHSEYDSVGTLTPIIQPPSPSKIQKLYYTCQRLFHLCQQRNSHPFISIIILLFNFIHTYA
jgi:hypothetical protein